MDTEIIYQKKFPPHESPDVETHDDELPENIQFPSFDKLMERITKETAYVVIPEREERAKVFINKAIEASETYEFDLTIEKRIPRISAWFCIDPLGPMTQMLAVIKEADDIDFLPAKEEGKLILCLDFYTHAEYVRGKRTRP